MLSTLQHWSFRVCHWKKIHLETVFVLTLQSHQIPWSWGQSCKHGTHHAEKRAVGAFSVFQQLWTRWGECNKNLPPNLSVQRAGLPTTLHSQWSPSNPATCSFLREPLNEGSGHKPCWEIMLQFKGVGTEGLLRKQFEIIESSTSHFHSRSLYRLEVSNLDHFQLNHL